MRNTAKNVQASSQRAGTCHKSFINHWGHILPSFPIDFVALDNTLPESSDDEDEFAVETGKTWPKSLIFLFPLCQTFHIKSPCLRFEMDESDAQTTFLKLEESLAINLASKPFSSTIFHVITLTLYKLFDAISR